MTLVGVQVPSQYASQVEERCSSPFSERRRMRVGFNGKELDHNQRRRLWDELIKWQALLIKQLASRNQRNVYYRHSQNRRTIHYFEDGKLVRLDQQRSMASEQDDPAVGNTACAGDCQVQRTAPSRMNLGQVQGQMQRPIRKEGSKLWTNIVTAMRDAGIGEVTKSKPPTFRRHTDVDGHREMSA